MMSSDSEGEDEVQLPDCDYCQENTSHPLFVYLISNRPTGCVNVDLINDSSAYIGKSRHPLHRLCSHNRVVGYRVGAKVTKGVAPGWMIEMVVGPFYAGGAGQFKEDWRKGFRNVVRRLIGGVELATRHDVNIYFRDQQTKQLVLHLIEQYA